MPACSVCGGPIVRKPRNLFRKIIDRAVFKCEHCGKRVSRRRTFFTIFLRYASCPKCGTPDLSRLASKDRVDGVTHNPFRRLMKLFGCPLYHCTFCRFQFRDWRSRQSDRKPPNKIMTA
jgi:endogenous inhibitor of DNA gyrase (YacG/DUF329 family)